MPSYNDPRQLYYVREGNSSFTHSNVSSQQRFARGVVSLVPISKGAQFSWRAGQSLGRFAKRGGFYYARRGGAKAGSYYRRASARVRRPIRGSRTYGRISRRLPFYRTRQRVRAATDLAADAAVVYYGGRRVYRKTRSLGARSRTSPSRTAYSQVSKPSGKRYTPKKARRRSRRRSRCPPGYYYNRKAGRCLRSKFR